VNNAPVVGATNGSRTMTVEPVGAAGLLTLENIYEERDTSAFRLNRADDD